jgi:SEC-C motif-containing protein
MVFVMKHDIDLACPCQSDLSYDVCCQPLLTKKYQASSAEALMRSRYTAYSLADTVYIFKTWHASTRPSLASLRNDPLTDWLGLKILYTEQQAETAIVEFVASYKAVDGIRQFMERSHFVLEKGKWFYLNGQ